MQTMSLPVALTDEELRARGAELARKVQLAEELTEARKDAAKAAADEIKEVAAEVASLSTVVTSRREYRDVEVDVRKNLEARTMDTFRIDTGELVHSRGLTTAELQENLFSVKVTEVAEDAG